MFATLHLQTSITIFVNYNSSCQIHDLALFQSSLYLCLSLPLLFWWEGAIKQNLNSLVSLYSYLCSPLLGLTSLLEAHLGPES